MDSKKLNQQITIQTKTTTRGTSGEVIETWTDTLTGIWAGFITTGGREYYAAQKLNAETTAVISMWYVSGITVTNRIKYGTRIFDILHVNNVGEANNELLISAKEVV